MSKIVRLMWVPVLLAACYTGWIFWQRHAAGSGASAVPEERDPLAAYGTAVKVVQFYARAQSIAPGEKTLLCYGAVNASTLRLDPPVEKVWPSMSRCFEVTPKTSTRYTLTAEGADHATDSKTVEIAVNGSR